MTDRRTEAETQAVEQADINQFLENVDAEVARAIGKFPQPNPTLAAMTEEAGEVAKALLHIREGKSVAWDDVYAEAVQLAAMACRIALEGDPTIGTIPTSLGAAPLGDSRKSPAGRASQGDTRP